MEIRIGTRGSKLALRQTEWVKERLSSLFPEHSFQVVKITTTGDKITDAPLAKIGGKGLFVKEIEEALLRGEIDMAVHSMKDLPVQLPPGLKIGAITQREDPRDVLISKRGGLGDLPPGSVIGTSSLRRRVQLLMINPRWQIRPLRGNLDTRLRKLRTEELSAIIVAAAGLIRLHLEGEATEYIPPEVILPAVGQGALGVEIRQGDKLEEIVSALHHPFTALAVRAERAFLAKLEGGCQVPIAAYGKVEGEKVILQGMVASLDGGRVFRGEEEGDDPEEVGVRLGERLLEAGAEEVLREIWR